MKKILIGIMALAALMTMTAVPSEANTSAQNSATVAASTQSLPNITCPYDFQCDFEYYDNGGSHGYFMAQSWNGGPWVRLTMVAGYNNNSVAPITCAVRYQCVAQYYRGYPEGDGYYMARQANGTIWVRLTRI